MYYEINVSKNKQHFFATAERSITSRSEFQKVFPVIREKFPESEGYKLDVSHWSHSGKQYDEEDIAELLSKK